MICIKVRRMKTVKAFVCMHVSCHGEQSPPVNSVSWWLRPPVSVPPFRRTVQLAVRGVDGGSGRVGLFLRIAEMRPSGYRQERNPLSVGTFSKCEPAPREQIPQPFQYDGAGTQSVAVRIPFLDGRGGTQGKIIAAFE